MTRSRRLSLALAALVLLLATAIGWLVASEPGLRFLWSRARTLSPVAVTGEVHGDLLGPLRVDGFRLELPRATVEVASADLDWSPRGLLEGRLLFTRAELHDLVVTVRPGAKGGGAPRIPAPPIPVDVRGSVERLTVRVPGEAGVLHEVRFDRAGVDAVAGPAQLKARAVSLDGYGGHLEAEGDVALRPDGPVRLATRWNWQPPQGERLRGHGTVTGTLARPRTDQSLDQVLEGTARGSLTWLDQPFAWQAELIASPVNIARLDRRARPLVVGGNLRAEGASGRLRLAADGRLKDPDWGAWHFRGEGAQVPDGWRLPLVSLDAVDGLAQVTASGFLYTRGAAAVALDLDWRDFPVPATAVAASPSGKVTVQGSLDHYLVAGTAVLARHGLPDGEAELEGNGDRRAFTLTALRAAWMEGEVTGTGRVQWRPFLAWDTELRARDLNPGRWRAEYPGRLSARVTSKGERRKAGLVADLALEGVSGTLRGRPVAGGGRFHWAGDLLRVESFDLVDGTAALSVQGELGARWDLRADLDAEQIEDMVPGVRGRVQAEVRLSGPRGQPWLRAEASGSELAWAGRRAGRLALKASIDLAGASPWDARVTGEALTAGGVTLDRLDLAGQGGPADHQLTVDAGAAGRSFHLEAHGAYAAQHWQGELSAGRVEDPALGIWIQAAPVALAVDPRSIRLGQGCWTHEGASVCLGLEGGVGREWSGEAELRSFPVAALQPFLPHVFQVNGLVDGRAAFRFLNALTALDLNVAATQGSFRFLLSGSDAVVTPYNRIDLRLQAGAQGFTGETRVELAGGDHVLAQAALPRWRPGEPLADQPLRGIAQASLGELVWVSLLVPDLAATGRLEGRFTLGGTLARPLLDGEAALVDNGQLALPLLGVSLEDLRFAVHTDGPDAMKITASARSGPGTLAVDGRASLAEEGWDLAVRVTGSNVEVARLPQARILATPDLRVEIQGRTIQLHGSVLVPSARIDLPEVTPPVQASSDVVIVDLPAGEMRRRPWTIVSEISLSFGDDVRLSGYGFAGRLGGQILVVEPAGGGAVGRGELQILDGKYTSYGQDLTIEEGRLLYGNAPLNNPGIQFRAVRQLEDVKVGVAATGRLKKPEVRLYSEPAMDDTQVLAYLVLGRPLETVTTEETGMLQRAAVSLGLVGGTELARRIGDQAGLDVVNVQPVQSSSPAQTVQAPPPVPGSLGASTPATAGSATQPYQASLVLGKYLSPRLYVEYAVGLWDTGNAWQMRYLLDKNWTVKAESGLQSGVDLLYTFEK